MKAISDNIRRLMRSRMIPSERQLAKQARVDQRTINRLLASDELPNPTTKVIYRVAKVLKVEPWMLLVPEFPFDSVSNPPLARMTSGGYTLIDCFEKASHETKLDAMKHLSYLMARYEHDSKSALNIEEAISSYSVSTKKQP